MYSNKLNMDTNAKYCIIFKAYFQNKKYNYLNSQIYFVSFEN